MTSSIQKPALVLVHGAWHNPTCFSHLIPHLTSLGYTTISTPTLPSANGGLPPSSTSTSSSSTNEKEEDEFPIWKADVSAVRTAVSALVENQELDVVVILHSYGGTPGTEALKGLAKKERVAKGEKGGVVALVYMAAFVIEEGKSTNGDAEADPLDVDFVVSFFFFLLLALHTSHLLSDRGSSKIVSFRAQCVYVGVSDCQCLSILLSFSELSCHDVSNLFRTPILFFPLCLFCSSSLS